VESWHPAAVVHSLLKETALTMTHEHLSGSATVDFENLVALHYEALFRFAFALTRSEADASDLTQQTFYTWAIKGDQLREVSKAKTWLFTTLHRAFLQIRRRENRFNHCELSAAETELPYVSPARASQLDSASVLRALASLDEVYQAPVAMFYLEDCPYKEIARILNVPIGTVKSRISRGIAQLHKLLTDAAVSGPGNQEAF
jgi:RNA polymerase sigma-70 factor (ECF subfamily)